MNQKQYSLVAAIIFAIFALAHLVRVTFDWSVSIGGWSAPMWLSWVAAVVAAGLSYYGFTLSKRSE